MKEYKDMYYKLFNKISDIIKELEDVQQETEEIFIAQQHTKDIEIIKLNNLD